MGTLRISVTLIITIMVSLATNAKDIHDFFVSEPNNVFNLLNSSTRLDMIDYYHSGSTPELQNQIGDKSQLMELTDNYIKVKLSESSTTEVKMIPISKRDTILVVAQTFYTPTPESKLTIYNTDWEELEIERYLKVSTLDDFITIPRNEGEFTMADAATIIPFTLIEYKLTADSNNLQAIFNPESYITTEGYEKIKPMLTDTLNYTLKGRKFKLAK